MFDTIAGLPLHALVVHVVVVLLPLASLGTIAIACVSRWDRRYGWLVVVCAAVATAAAYVAVESGEVLASRIGTPQAHYTVARWLPWFALAQLVVVAALWWVERGSAGGYDLPSRRRAQRRGGAARALAVVAVLVALATLVWTVRTGDSGARAVWAPIIEHTTPGTQPVG